MKIFLLSLLACAVNGKVFQWIGPNNMWSNGANWEGGLLPTETSVVSFPESFSNFGTRGGSLKIDVPEVSVSKIILPKNGRIKLQSNMKMTITGKGPATNPAGTPVKWATKSAVAQDPSCPNNWGIVASGTAPSPNTNHDIPCADDDINFETSSLQIVWPNNTFLKSIKIKDESSSAIYDISNAFTGYESNFAGGVSFVRNSLETFEGIRVSSYCIKASGPECDYGDDVKKAEDKVKEKEHDLRVNEEQAKAIKNKLNSTTDTNEIVALQKQLAEIQKQIDEALLALKGAKDELKKAEETRDATTTVTPDADGSGDNNSSGSGLPIIPIAAGAGGLLLLIIIIIFIVRRRKDDEPKDTQGRSVVAFENPMYEGTGKADAEYAGAEDGDEGLYDEPAYAGQTQRENPMYSSQEQLYGDDDGDEDTGYLDVSVGESN